MVYTMGFHGDSGIFAVDLYSQKWMTTDSTEVSANGKSNSHDSNSKDQSMFSVHSNFINGDIASGNSNYKS
jgi:hypothetical protein